MLGAIVGDIVGSRFERSNCHKRDFELFAGSCTVTDDTIMSLAVAKSILETAHRFPNQRLDEDNVLEALSESCVQAMRQLGRKYPDCGFGHRFRSWVMSDDPKPYNSFGNGAAMRVSPVAALNGVHVLAVCDAVTKTTHDHPEGIKGARAVTAAIRLARRGALKSEIRAYIDNNYYPLDFTIRDIAPSYGFDASCQGSVPQAITCFLESDGFEDAIRIAIRLGGDSDTIASIAGAIAEAYYGIPEEIRDQALRYLDPELAGILDAWEHFCPPYQETFRVLTKYLGKFEEAILLQDRYSSSSLQLQPEEIGRSFADEMNAFIRIHPQYDSKRYASILDSHALPWRNGSPYEQALQPYSDQDILGMLRAIKEDQFLEAKGLMLEASYGKLLDFIRELKNRDWNGTGKRLQSIRFLVGGYFQGHTTYFVDFATEAAPVLQIQHDRDAEARMVQLADPGTLTAAISKLHPEYWGDGYTDPLICDGTQWSVEILYADGAAVYSSGSNLYPKGWKQMLALFADLDAEKEPERTHETPQSGSSEADGTGGQLIVFQSPKELDWEVEQLRIELSKLVMRRDFLLLTERRTLEIQYRLKFGGLEYEIHNLQCAINREQRKADLMQRSINRNEPIDMEAIEATLNEEFREYMAWLKTMQEAVASALEISHQSRRLSAEETDELKKNYRAIVKALHPDLHPDLDEVKKQLFQRAVDAYARGDLEELRLISSLTADAVSGASDAPSSNLYEETARLQALIDRVQAEITRAAFSFPHTFKDILESPEKTKAKQQELRTRIEELKQVLASWREITDGMAAYGDA